MLLGLAHGVLYALIIPPWQAPDEPGHFEHSYLLSRQWHVLGPVRPDPAFELNLIASLYANRYWDYVPHAQPDQMPLRLADLNTFAGRSRTLDRPSLSYVPYALALLPVEHQDIDLQLRLLRLLSACSLPLLVWLAWRAASLLFPEDAGPAIVAAALVALIPQHAYIQASVNDGNLADIASGAFFLVLTSSAVSGLHWRSGLALAALCLAALLCKNTTMFLVPTVAVAALLLVARRGFSRRDALLASGALLAVAAIGSRFAPRLAQWRSVSLTWRTLIAPGSYDGQRLAHYWGGIVATFESFWGRFGWMNVRMDGGVYLGIAIICGGVALTGVVRMAWGTLPRPRSAVSLLLNGLAILFSSAFILGTFVIYYDPAGLFSQGRYLFPVMLPIAVTTAYASSASLHSRLGRGIVVAVLLALLVLASYALFGVAVPFFA